MLGDPVLTALGLADPREAAEPYLLLAEVLTALHREGELVPRLEPAGRRSGEPLSGDHPGGEYVKAKRLDRAEAIYRVLAVRSPSIAAYRGLAELYEKDKRYDDLLGVLGEAVAHLAQSLSAGRGRRPAGWRTRNWLTESFRLPTCGGRPIPRASLFRRSSRRRPGPGRQTLRRRGRVLQRRHRGQARRRRPTAPDWGLGLSLKEQYARAINVFRRGADQQAQPAGDPTFHYYLAGALEKAGRTDEALAAAQKAVQMASAQKPANKSAASSSPRRASPIYQLHVAGILFHAKRFDAAAKAYGEVIQKYASDYDLAGGSARAPRGPDGDVQRRRGPARQRPGRRVAPAGARRVPRRRGRPRTTWAICGPTKASTWTWPTA